jgi:predicted O-methyltransferase YrrM
VTDQPETLTSANRRLLKEVKQLRERVAALEQSRWWRLHPRFVLTRTAGRFVRRRDSPSPKAACPDVSRAAADATAERFRAEVLARGDFSEDWFTIHISVWERVMAELHGKRSVRVLELGSFEGLATCFLLWRLPNAHVTTVDTFAGIPSYAPYGIGGPDLEHRFDHNVALVDAARVRKLVGLTRDVVPRLIDEKQTYDLIYVDASHHALDVLVDAALSWQLLAPLGIAIFDDYGSIPPEEDPLQHPARALDAFLTVVRDRLEVIVDQGQLIVRKHAANRGS